MRLIDADVLMEILTNAIRHMQSVAKILDEEDDPEIQMEIKSYTDIANGVKNMPTIKPQRWVPCSERLPEKDGEYLVANLTIKGKPYVYGIDTFANDLYQVDKYDFRDKKGQKGWVFFHYEYGYMEDKTVVAWMPLPDAYMGG